jgi:O-succinylbenzoic acid--CoA ligase
MDTIMNILWENSDSLVLMNPCYASAEQARFQRILEVTREFPGHVWLSTSGSSSPKWVGLSKQAILSSAEAVNRHLESTAEDVWIQALPDFHVGGLSIWARAYLSGAAVRDFRCAHPGKWQAETFYHYIQEAKGTLTSLVPAQLHDLVALGWRAPSSLRAVILGGGALLPLLYEQAVALEQSVLHKLRQHLYFAVDNQLFLHCACYPICKEVSKKGVFALREPLC